MHTERHDDVFEANIGLPREERIKIQFLREKAVGLFWSYTKFGVSQLREFWLQVSLNWSPVRGKLLSCWCDSMIHPVYKLKN